MGQAYILDSRPTRRNNQLEVVDQVLGGRPQPRRLGILLRREPLPVVSGPLVRSGRKLNFIFDAAVHTSALGHRRVMLYDDFGIGIQALQLPDKTDAVLGIAFGIFRISKND